MLVAIDIDGVLYPLHEIIRDWLVENKLVPQDVTLKEAFNFLRSKNTIFINNVFNIPFLYERRLPSKRIINQVEEISKDAEVIYLTQRPDTLKRITYKFLSDFPAPEAVFFVDDKQKFCYENGVDILFDDRMINLINHENTLAVCVQSFNHPEVVEPRFCSLLEAYEFAKNTLEGGSRVIPKYC